MRKITVWTDEIKIGHPKNLVRSSKVAADEWIFVILSDIFNAFCLEGKDYRCIRVIFYKNVRRQFTVVKFLLSVTE